MSTLPVLFVLARYVGLPRAAAPPPPAPAPPASGYVLRSDGSYVLRADGSRVLRG